MTATGTDILALAFLIILTLLLRKVKFTNILQLPKILDKSVMTSFWAFIFKSHMCANDLYYTIIYVSFLSRYLFFRNPKRCFSLLFSNYMSCLPKLILVYLVMYLICLMYLCMYVFRTLPCEH